MDDQTEVTYLREKLQVTQRLVEDQKELIERLRTLLQNFYAEKYEYEHPKPPEDIL